MSDDEELTEEVSDEDTVYSLEEDDDETAEAIRAYIG